MKFENTEVWGFKHALRGMRNPKNSWDKSDSGICTNSEEEKELCYGRSSCLLILQPHYIGGKKWIHIRSVR